MTTIGDCVLHLGDCLDVLRALPDGSVDAVVTDPPYGLSEPRSGGDGVGKAFAPRDEEAKAKRRGGFMGKAWDADVPGPETWQAVRRTLKPGGYLLAFGGSRTQHRLACAIEDAGFEIRDCLLWLYGTGFPKGQGCLKPAYEPILLARRPGPKVLPLGIDECRVPTDGEPSATAKRRTYGYTPNLEKASDSEARGKIVDRTDPAKRALPRESDHAGRYPANVTHDGSDEVLEAFAAFGECGGGTGVRGASTRIYGGGKAFTAATGEEVGFDDIGTAARFFYTAKASKEDRGEGNTHATVKPTSLMRWLVKLVCPVDGVVLDPFLGSGTTAVAAAVENRKCIGIERDHDYFAIAERRIRAEYARTPLFD